MPRFVLYGETDRRYAIEAVKAAKIGMEVRVVKPSRTLEQNALFHSQVGDIAKQLQWHGELHDKEWWKRRLTLAWLMETDQNIEIIADDLSGSSEFATLLPHTSELNVEQFTSLVEFTYAFGSQNGVIFQIGST